jgi:hypothetical protein
MFCGSKNYDIMATFFQDCLIGLVNALRASYTLSPNVFAKCLQNKLEGDISIKFHIFKFNGYFTLSPVAAYFALRCTS